jgi:hypothetical protein
VSNIEHRAELITANDLVTMSPLSSANADSASSFIVVAPADPLSCQRHGLQVAPPDGSERDHVSQSIDSRLIRGARQIELLRLGEYHEDPLRGRTGSWSVNRNQVIDVGDTGCGPCRIFGQGSLVIAVDAAT